MSIVRTRGVGRRIGQPVGRSAGRPLGNMSGLAFALPLDNITSAVLAFSVAYKLRSDYTGAAFRVRRSSDDAEQDIGFSGNDVDEAALSSFVGSGDGFVVTEYDQSGTGNNITQTTAASQPVIVQAGLIVKLNNLPIAKFDGTDDFLDTATAVTDAPATMFAVVQFSAFAESSRNARIIDLHGASNSIQVLRSDNSADWHTKDTAHEANNAATRYDQSPVVDTTYVLSATFDGSANKVWVNGTLASEIASADMASVGGSGTTLGNRSDQAATTKLDGLLGDVIVLNAVASEADRQSIDEYLKSTWGVA